MKTDVNTLKQNVSNLQTQVSNNASNISNLTQRVTNIEQNGGGGGSTPGSSFVVTATELDDYTGITDFYVIIPEPDQEEDIGDEGGTE